MDRETKYSSIDLWGKKSMAIIVTGAKGFIGRNLVRILRERTEETIIELDMESIGNPDDLKELEPYYTYHKEKYSGIYSLDVSKIYHMGAWSSTTGTHVASYYSSIIRSSLDWFYFAQSYDIPIVYASSASVYGNFANVRGNWVINPLNYYAMSKAMVDLKAEDIIREKPDTLIKGYRFYNVFGEDEESKGDMASPVYKFVQQARRGESIKIFDVNASRDLLAGT